MIESKGICLVDHFVNIMTIGGELGWFQETNTAGSTGYSWKYRPDNSGVYDLVEEITLSPSTKAVGVPGVIIWKFKAIKEGNGSMLFELYPPGRKEPAKTITVEIEVNK